MIEQAIQLTRQSGCDATSASLDRRPMQKRIKSAMIGNDVQHVAEQLVEQHGRYAATIAADRFLEHQRAGDGAGVAKWVEVMLVIRELMSDEDATKSIP
jgi:hypothetical protein